MVHHLLIFAGIIAGIVTQFSGSIAAGEGLSGIVSLVRIYACDRYLVDTVVYLYP
jgi:hypothetical protein